MKFKLLKKFYSGAEFFLLSPAVKDQRELSPELVLASSESCCYHVEIFMDWPQITNRQMFLLL